MLLDLKAWLDSGFWGFGRARPAERAFARATGSASMHVLWRAVDEARLLEGDLFITNSVACRPPHGPPSVNAILACHRRLVHDIEAHPRTVIVALGRTAVRAVTGKRGFLMLEGHGEVLSSIWAPVVPTLHPAFVLRRPALFPMLVDDLKHARRVAYGPGV